LRTKKNLSFSELSGKTGISVSYLNEIEKGKKYPKATKIKTLAKALDSQETYLTSDDYDEGIAPVAELLQSNFLNELPLDLFGIELSKVVEIIANAPARVGAFITTLLDISRNYALREENFYFGALRSYLELHNNFFPELEAKALEFAEAHNLPAERPLPELVLKNLVEEKLGYSVKEHGLEDYPELSTLRGVFLPKKKELLLSPFLTPIQRSFQYGKELAFSYLEMDQRAYTSSLLKTKNFEEVINHSRAIYFSVVLHMPLQMIIADVGAFFQRAQWNGQAFLEMMQKYDATPEMFYHRLTNILPEAFGIKKMFFLRFVHDVKRDNYEIDRELHLNHRHQPHGNGLDEHYCRRWVSLSLLKDLGNKQVNNDQPVQLVGAQLSSYMATGDQYLVLTIARSDYPTPNRNVSVSIGMLLNKNLQKQINFLDDPAIERRMVHTTCERCFITDCQERAADPVVVDRRKKLSKIEEKLNDLLS
ncbi:MAG: helix-turn-helix domain-containing protein, partial [Bacteroidota bacterium]